VSPKQGMILPDKNPRDEIYVSRFENKKDKSALKVGDFVMCEDKGGNYRSEVKAVDNSMRTQRVYLHFHGFSARHDIWLPVDSSRIARLPGNR